MTINISKWFLKGFNEDFIRSIKIKLHNLASIKIDYVKSLVAHMDIKKKDC